MAHQHLRYNIDSFVMFEIVNVRMAGRGRTEAFRQYRYQPLIPRGNRVEEIIWGKELKGSDESKQERTVVQVEIPIADSEHTATCLYGVLQEEHAWYS